MLDAALVLLILICGLAAVLARRLLASALWLAGCSALLAVQLYRLGAFEVAVIELSVGAGLVTVLFVFAINVAGEDSPGRRSIIPRGLAWVLCLAPMAALAGLSLPRLSGFIPQTAGGLADVLWGERALDVVVQIVLVYSGTLGLLGLLAEKEAPLRQPAAREVAQKRERALQTMETAARQEEVRP